METLEKKVNSAFEEQDLEAIDRYLKARLEELDTLAQRGDPWVFGACCTFIEMLAKREKECNNDLNDNARNKDGSRFKNFVKIYLMPSNPFYQDAEKELKNEATKQSGKEQAKEDDPEIAQNLWHILRCGVVHSFSMKKQESFKKELEDSNQQNYKILLGHRKNRKSTSDHLKVVEVNDEGNTYKALCIMAEDFVEDLRRCTQKIIKKAKDSSSFYDNLKEQFINNPPLGWLSWEPKTEP